MKISKRLFTGFLVAAMIAGSPTVVPTTPVAAAVEATQNQYVQSGNFTWGFRKSLVRYINGPIARGKIELIGQATSEKNGLNTNFSFPIDTANSTLDEQGNARLPLQGGLHFLGHYNSQKEAWDLDVTLSNLFLDIKGTNVTIFADFVTKGDLSVAPDSLGLEGKEETSGTAVPLATFELDEPISRNDAIGGYSFVNQDSAVTAKGFQQAFLNSKYAPGEPLDGPNLEIITNSDKPVENFGKESSVDSENRTGVIIGSVVGILALIGGIIAGLKQFGPQFGIRLPF